MQLRNLKWTIPILTALIFAIGCSSEPEVVTKEVIKKVEVPVEVVKEVVVEKEVIKKVEVPVEVVKEVVVEKEVIKKVEVPVEVVKEVVVEKEVIKEIEVPVEVVKEVVVEKEVIKEIEVPVEVVKEVVVEKEVIKEVEVPVEVVKEVVVEKEVIKEIEVPVEVVKEVVVEKEVIKEVEVPVEVVKEVVVEKEVTKTESSTPTGTPVPMTTTHSDRAALEALYDATGGDNWEWRINWKSDEPLDQWYGVSTNRIGRVTNLNMDDPRGVAIGLRDPIPPELGSLTELIEINFGERSHPARVGKACQPHETQPGEQQA